MNLGCILKNRTVIGLLCILLSLLICFGLTPLFNNALKAQTEMVRVVKDIRKGEVILKESIEKVQVGAYNLPVSVANNEKDVMGKYASVDLLKGDYILPAKIMDKPLEENEYLYKLDGKMQAISISIKSFALGLSGKLKAGDIVSIIASDYGEMRETLIPPELQYVEVIAVTNSKGWDENIENKSEKPDVVKPDEEKQLPSTVTVLANTKQAKILAELEERSKIHISLVYRGNPESAHKFLQAQDEIVNKTK